MKTVTFQFAARKHFRKLPADVQAKIIAKLERYAATGAGDVISMKGQDGARMRIDDYRAVFIETDTDVEVIDVGHRREIYR